MIMDLALCGFFQNPKGRILWSTSWQHDNQAVTFERILAVQNELMQMVLNFLDLVAMASNLLAMASNLMASNLLAMASNLMASNLLAMASNLMASNLLAMASNLMASNLLAMASNLMASNLLAMASNLMASNLLAMASNLMASNLLAMASNLMASNLLAMASNLMASNLLKPEFLDPLAKSHTAPPGIVCLRPCWEATCSGTEAGKLRPTRVRGGWFALLAKPIESRLAKATWAVPCLKRWRDVDLMEMVLLTTHALQVTRPFSDMW